jgi:hypothetical protein
MTSKHKVSTSILIQSRSLIILRIKISSRLYTQVIRRQEVDPQAICAVFSQEIGRSISILRSSQSAKLLQSSPNNASRTFKHIQISTLKTKWLACSPRIYQSAISAVCTVIFGSGNSQVSVVPTNARRGSNSSSRFPIR